MLNGRIKDEGSGEAEWLRRTKSNKRIEPTGDSGAFIREIEGLVRCVPVGSSAALGRFAYKESRVDRDEANRANAQLESSRPKGCPTCQCTRPDGACLSS